MKIVVDAFGGDNAPTEIIKGCSLALNAHQGFKLVLTGKKEIIKELLEANPCDMGRVEIVDARDVITNDDIPTDAIRAKTDSSLVKALEITKTDPQCVGLVSAGSTGAVLTGAFLKIGRIRGIARPALAPELPTVNGGKVLLIDCGANVDCKPNMLCDFALMGDAYSKGILKVKNPRIALLSNGTEDKKGNELTKEAFTLLKGLPINFVGNMEARDITSGEYDVVVADGFYGNIALKASEGAVNLILKLIKNEIYSSLKNKIAGSMLKKSFDKIRKTVDFNAKGGAPFLGVEKVVIKAHGSSLAASICGSIKQAVDMHLSGLVENIKNLTDKPILE